MVPASNMTKCDTAETFYTPEEIAEAWKLTVVRVWCKGRLGTAAAGLSPKVSNELDSSTTDRAVEVGR